MPNSTHLISPPHTDLLTSTHPSYASAKQKTHQIFPNDQINNTTTPYLTVQKDSPQPPDLVEPSEYRPHLLASNLINMLETICKAAQVQQSAAEGIVDSITNAMNEQQSKANQVTKSEQEHLESEVWCGYAKKVATCLLAAFSLALGGKLLIDHPESAQHLVCGGAMILSALSTLVGNTMINANDSPKIASFLVFISAGFGLIAGTTYLSLSADSLAQVAQKIITTSLGVMNGTAQLAKHYSQMQIKDLRAEMIRIQELLTRFKSIASSQKGYLDKSTRAIIKTTNANSDAALGLERAKNWIIAHMINSRNA